MKIEQGKRYRLRNGKIAECVRDDCNFGDDRNCLMLVKRPDKDNADFSFYCTEDGVVNSFANKFYVVIAEATPWDHLKPGQPVLCWTEDGRKYIHVFVDVIDGKPHTTAWPDYKHESMTFWDHCEAYNWIADDE